MFLQKLIKSTDSSKTNQKMKKDHKLSISDPQANKLEIYSED